jgi:imidazole glycerol-phosphate synthase subunit HisF
MRLIARLDVKNEYVIKGIHLEGLRKLGNPNVMAKSYYDAGIDEIVVMDAVASLYDRNNLFWVIEEACKEVFVPLTIGGGLRTFEDVEKALLAGSDKVALNTAAVRRPEFVTELAKTYGSQCVVASIEAKRTGPATWQAYIDNGRDPTGLDVVAWARRLEDLGAGEILLTSVDQEGTKKGFDVELCARVNAAVGIPVICSGGWGAPAHFEALTKRTRPSAVATASLLHYGISTVGEIKQTMRNAGVTVRQ